MAESMQGLHRSHRCTEVSNANIGEKVTVSLQFSQINRNGSVMIWKAALIISFTAMIPTVTMFLIVSHAPDKNPVIESQIFVKVSWISVMVPVTLE